ncbi:hypothetical protein [Marinoscillum furvescens]|uniref:Uncharacterized protein n=1 Tax=Marinoscillum furvescens DSM 4134 TaxID=1122208 RepID=A0A3D9L4R7_MARFU|nr:hypothetical protein [Marinoscillum furvescens]RED99404.1 hypothetical protein C7460_10820 [Marinoscillum furvescens DSM 4134]
MHTLKLTLRSFALFSLLAACQETNNRQLSDGFQVRIGQICGWCAGEHELALSAETYSYTYDHACDDELDVPEQFFDTPDQDWHELTRHYHKQDFAKETIATCNVCADGCDYWVIVSDGEFSHEIRFGNPKEVKTRSVRIFSKKLVTLLKEAQEEFGQEQ